MSATSSPKKFPRGQPKCYSHCLLYNSKEASQKLKGLTFAACNPKLEKNPTEDVAVEEVSEKKLLEEPISIKVSDKMMCSLCDVVFVSRSDQKHHYKSDWHRYNIKQRLKGRASISEEAFDEISGNVSSISGSDSDSDIDSDAGRTTTSADLKARPKPAGIPSRLATSGNTSTDSESDSGQTEDVAQRLPKVYFRTADGELISLYRCVLCHKRWQPTKQGDLLSLAEDLPEHMMWALFMAGGGHFAGAIFSKGNLVAHKTFHRYVVRAKRGTAQGSRDSQGGNAPKSAGATLRRYNEAALTQEIQDLITSWDEHIKLCDKIFLRAPSFNRKIFFGGKTPPFKKDDMRIRLIPFQTRRPTFNEIRRVYELLASVECYGDEAEIQDFIPISPPQVFDAETGQLTIRDENQLSPRRRKVKNKLSSASPLAGQGQQASSKEGSGAEVQTSEGPRTEGETERLKGRQLELSDFKRQGDPGQENLKLALPDHVTEANHSTGTSTASESELVEQMETMNLLEHKEFYATKKPKKKKKQKNRRNSLRCQKSPESSVYDEEKYHLKNNLYTACKTGDIQSLSNLLAIFSVQNQPQVEAENSCDQIVESCDHAVESQDKSQGSCDEIDSSVKLEEHKPNQGAVELTSDITMISNEVQDSAKTLESEKDGSTEKEKVVSDYAMEAINNNSSSQNDGRTTEGAQFVSDNAIEATLASNNNSSSQMDSRITRDAQVVINTSCNKKQDDEEIPKNHEEPMTENLGSENTTRIFDQESCISNEGDKISDHLGNSIEENVNEFDTSNKAKDVESAFNSCIGNDGTLNVEEERNKSGDKAVINNEDNQVPDSGTVTDPSLPLNKLATVQFPGGLQDLSPVVTVGILSETFGDNETTLLHVAAREGHKDIVTVLMTTGADPTIRDRAGLTPYMVSKDKPTRNEFRKFRGQWPDKYDYARAQIPPPLSEEQENERKRKEMERKKAQKKAKQDRQKEKRAEDAAREAEEREKNRFLSLSDREKRALAAERRMLDQASREGANKPVLSRCFQCGGDMTGKVPFEYLDYKFCASKCLQQHRKQKISK